MKKKVGKQKEKISLIIILTIILAVSVFWSARKDGYFIDEVYTFGLANNSYKPFLETGESSAPLSEYMYMEFYGSDLRHTFYNIKSIFKDIFENGMRGSEIFKAYKADIYAEYSAKWFTQQDFLNYAAVQDNQRFDFPSVYYNQFRDVHPPLYYLTVHLLSSFFPDTVPKNVCLFINIFFLLLTCFTLYKFSVKFFNDYRMGCLITLFYGLSMGTLSMTMYLRMYSMLTFFIMASLWFHLQILEDNLELNKKNILGLILTTVAGFCTQYFFIIYLFFIVIVISIIILKEKKYRNFIKYMSVLISTGILSIIIWPVSVRHMLNTSKSETMTDNFFSNSYISSMKDYINIIIKGFFANKVIFFLFFLIIVVTIVLLIRNKKKGSYVLFKGISRKNLLVIVPLSGYLLVIMKITDIQSDRYIMSTYPMLAFLIVAIIYSFLLLSHRERYLIIISAFLALILMFSRIAESPNYLYPMTQEDEKFVNMVQNKRCVFLNTAGNTYTVFVPDFIKNNNQVVILNEADIAKLNQAGIKKDEDIFVYLSDSVDEDKVLKYISDLCGERKGKYIRTVFSCGVDKDEKFYTKIYRFE